MSEFAGYECDGCHRYMWHAFKKDGDKFTAKNREAQKLVEAQLCSNCYRKRGG